MLRKTHTRHYLNYYLDFVQANSYGEPEPEPDPMPSVVSSSVVAAAVVERTPVGARVGSAVVDAQQASAPMASPANVRSKMQKSLHVEGHASTTCGTEHAVKALASADAGCVQFRYSLLPMVN